MPTQVEIDQAAGLRDVHRQIRAATKRLAMVNFAVTIHGHDPALVAESEGLITQIAGLEAQLKGNDDA